MALTCRTTSSQQLIDLVGALGGTWHGRTAMCLCPAHSDSTLGLSIRQGTAEFSDLLRRMRPGRRSANSTRAHSRPFPPAIINTGSECIDQCYQPGTYLSSCGCHGTTMNWFLL